MKKLVIIVLVLLSARVFAQSTADSTYFYQQSSDHIRVSQLNSTFLLSTPINKIGFAKLYGNLVEGGFRPAQQAQRSTHMGIYSEGITKINRFTTSGYFSFSRTWQDSLAWSTKGLERDDQPYYYGSVKAGAFERFNYSLGGTLAYNLVKNKLYIGTGIDYTYNSATRSVDPRPTVNTYQMLLKPELIYRFKENFIGLAAKWGYGTETMGIAFKNRDFQNSTTGYPDRVNYLIQGYGLITNSQGTSAPLKRIAKFFGVGLNYSGSFGTYRVKSTLSYDNQQEDNYQDLAQSVKRAYISYYDTDLISAFIQLDKIGRNKSQQLSISYTNQNSNDINVIFYAVNYRFLQTTAQLKYLLRLNQHQRFSPEFGLTSSYNDVDKKDLSTAHLIGYTKLENTLISNFYYTINAKEKLSSGLTIGYVNPIASHLSIPVSQQTVFTRGVVFPDYTFNTSTALKVGASVNYISASIFKQFKTGFTANAIYYNQLTQKNVFPTATRLLGKQLVDLNLAINLYF